jgi:DNA-binding transcriptional MerR regulator
VRDDESMLSAKQAAKLAGISPQRLRYWEKTDLISPVIRRRISTRNEVRLYGFRELIEVCVAAALVNRPGISLQHLRQIIDRLRQSDYAAPLAELRFAVEGREVFFQHPDGTWEGSRNRLQLVAHEVLELEPIRNHVRSQMGRSQEQLGQIERRRGSHGSKPTFSGTRVPVAAIESYIRAGSDDEQILQAFPNLDKADLSFARRRVRREAS